MMETAQLSLQWLQSLNYPGLRLVAWLGSVLVVFGVLNTVRYWLVRFRGPFSILKRIPSYNILSRLLPRLGRWFVLAIAIAICARIFYADGRWAIWSQKLLIVAAAIQLMIWSSVLVDILIENIILPRSSEGSVRTTSAVVRFLGRLLTYVGIVLLTLDNLGFNVTTLIAGLGVGGVAIALAIQNILGDLFSSLTIVLDKPFEVGDFIVVGTENGHVESVGLKTTRVRSLSGEQLIFSNSDLLQSRIKNFKRMQERRVLFQFGVVYQTPASVLREIPNWLGEILEKIPETRLDRCHFFRFGDSSLDFECVYYVASSEYNVYMNAHQKLCLEMVERFAAQGVEFAYPTRTLYMVNGNEPEKPPTSS